MEQDEGHASLLYQVYKLISYLAVAAALPIFLIYALISGRHLNGLAERFGFFAPLSINHENSPRIWLHAASVGEVQVARALINELRQALPNATLILSTMTEQGQQVARRQLGDDVRCIYAPLDLPIVARLAVKKLRPTAYICLETELWPNLLARLQHDNVPAVLLNGRLSERSFKRYRLAPRFMASLLDCFSRIATIRPADAERYIAIGAAPQRVAILGNAKYDLHIDATPETAGRYRERLQLTAGQPMLVAGSTHGDEETMLVETFRRAKRSLPDLVMVVAPRHIERIDEIEAAYRVLGLEANRFSHCKTAGRTADIVLVDGMGELTGLYGAASYIFCGGSLVNRGGHNLMEAAIWGKPVCYGPSMKDFLDAKELLEAAQAGFMVNSPAELADTIIGFAENPEQYAAAGQRARQTALAQQGSAGKQVQLILEVLTQRNENGHSAIA
ncbi:MAG: 3-deoxy-D-manno-octulosonic acid transferase [Desulfobulbaceae bacterium]|nr:3-deoxy-D-manno-octulosonic acid transferase [Desulfobulbaceae bacterium]